MDIRSRALVAALILFAAACSMSGVAGSESSDGSSKISVTLPDEWVPVIEQYRLTYVAEVVERFGLTEADMATIDLDGIDPQPYDAFPTKTDYDRAFAGFVAGCLRGKGYAAEVIDAAEGPAVDIGRLPLDDPAVSKAHGLCVVEGLFRFPPRPRPVTPQEWQMVYEEQVATAECLEEKFGYRANVPSFDAYVDDPSAWVAYDAVPEALPPGQWRAVNEECPQP